VSLRTDLSLLPSPQRRLSSLLTVILALCLRFVNLCVETPLPNTRERQPAVHHCTLTSDTVLYGSALNTAARISAASNCSPFSTVSLLSFTGPPLYSPSARATVRSRWYTYCTAAKYSKIGNFRGTSKIEQISIFFLSNFKV
jgi:hypothetical protein